MYVDYETTSIKHDRISWEALRTAADSPFGLGSHQCSVTDEDIRRRCEMKKDKTMLTASAYNHFEFLDLTQPYIDGY